MTHPTPPEASKPVDLDELERVAKAATPGPWHREMIELGPGGPMTLGVGSPTDPICIVNGIVESPPGNRTALIHDCLLNETDEGRIQCQQIALARLRAESAELKQKVSDLEAETMTLTSERDTARMGQDELLAKLRSEGQDWRLAAAAFEANAAEIAELRRQLEAVDRALGLPPDRAPRRLALLIELRESAAAAQRVAALSEAERRVIDSACARLEYHNTISAFAHWSRAEKQKVNDLDSALDGATEALLALRAAEGETDA